MKRRSRVIIVSTAGLLLVCSATAAAADPPTGSTASFGRSELRTGVAGSPDAVPAGAAAWRDPASIPLSERREAMKRTKASYATNIGTYTRAISAGRVSAAAAYDPFTLQECKDGYPTKYDPADYVWKKNHFAACVLFWTDIPHFKCPSAGGTCVQDGNTRLDGQLLMSTMRTTRTIKYEVTVKGNSDPKFTYGVQDRTVSIFGLAQCYSYLTGDACTTPTTLPTAPLSTWYAGKAYTVSFTDTGTVGDPAYPAAESRSYFASYAGLGMSNQYSYSKFAGVRCDTASYASGGGCIFDSLKGDLHYGLRDTTISEVAQHVKDAQTDVSSTKPGLNGTIIPGGHASNRTLTRNYYDTALVSRSRTKVQNTCKQYWGTNYTINDDGEKMECDEYPFARTYQNAATTTPTSLLSYSARPVLKSQNGLAGSAYGVWLTNDHLLDGDPFWVTVDP